MRLLFTGLCLMMFALGTRYSGALLPYRYYVLLAAVGFLLYGVFAARKKKLALRSGIQTRTLFGMLLLALYLGGVSPNVPFDLPLLLVGLLLAIAGFLWKVLKEYRLSWFSR